MDIAFLVSNESRFQAITNAVVWSAAIKASNANNDAAGENIQSSTNPVKAPIENPPTTVINRMCFLKFKHKTSIAIDFMSSCNAGVIYELSFKKFFYSGLDVGRVIGLDVGLADGRDGLPQAPHALKLLFILISFKDYHIHSAIDCK